MRITILGFLFPLQLKTTPIYQISPKTNKLQKVLTVSKDKVKLSFMKHGPTKEITYTAVAGKQHTYESIGTEEG